MARLLTYKDGRLRTGRVAAGVFILFLFSLGFLFKISRPVDQAMVVVRHMFEPKKQQEPEKPPETRPASKAVSEPVNPEEKIETTPGSQQSGEKQAKNKPSEEKIDPAPEIRPVQNVPEKPENSAKMEPVVSEPKQMDSTPADTVTETEIPVPDKKKEAFNQKAGPPQETEKSESPKKATGENPLRAIPSENGITVSKAEYLRLFKNWQKTGINDRKDEKIPLRVENLENVYSLFQMKPVAVVRGDQFYDLSDTTRISEASLEDFSATVFRVDQPWSKWSHSLKALGIRQSDKVEVRYYMYGFIRSAIFSRVNQTFQWCKSTGRIDAGTSPADVDVLGRAYVIQKQNGGRFGVFVPVSLDTRDGKTVVIDPDCFGDQADVQALKSAGLI